MRFYVENNRSTSFSFILQIIVYLKLVLKVKKQLKYESNSNFANSGLKVRFREFGTKNKDSEISGFLKLHNMNHI